MTQPYGGQQQPNQNYGGYPQAPAPPSGGFAAMPQAPQEHSGPIPRPGATTAAAVLAFVQGGLTLITTGILMLGLAALQSLEDEASAGGVEIQGTLTEAWLVSVVQLVGVGLLIWGGVKLMAGTPGMVFTIAVILQIVLCAYWLIRGAAPLVPLALIVMPIVALVLALGQASKQYVQSRSGR